MLLLLGVLTHLLQSSPHLPPLAPPSTPSSPPAPPKCYEYRQCTVVNVGEGFCGNHYLQLDSTSTAQECLEAAMADSRCKPDHDATPPRFHVSFGKENGTRAGVCLCDTYPLNCIVGGTGLNGYSDLGSDGYDRFTCYTQACGRSATSSCEAGTEVTTLDECEQAARYLYPRDDPSILDGDVHTSVKNWSTQPLHTAAYNHDPPGHPAWGMQQSWPDRCFARADWSTQGSGRPILYYSERTLSDYSNVNIQCVDVCQTDCPLVSGAKQDPHLTLARGGRADFRGRNDTSYAMISSPNVSVAMVTHDALFSLHGNVINGSFMTVMHGVFRTSKGRLLHLTYDSRILNDALWHWKMVRGSCAKAYHRVPFSMSPHTKRVCDDVVFSVDMSTLSIDALEWSFRIQASPVYGSRLGPTRRLDLTCEFRGNETLVRPHGLIGQSYDGGLLPRQGQTDEYPPPNSNTVFTTTAEAQGAIDGHADDYVLAAPESTSFRFSRFQ